MDIIIKFFKIGLLILVTQFLLGSGCRKGTTPCVFGGYSFAVTAEWSPQKEIYHVGDTIFLVSVFSKKLTDVINPSLTMDYSNATRISGDIGIAAPDSVLKINKPAKDSFQFVSITGSFLERIGNQNQGINFSYMESDTNYHFKGAIICKKKGLYGISVDNLISRGIESQNCTNAGFKMHVTNPDKHIRLYETALGIKLDTESIKKIYCFIVQ